MKNGKYKNKKVIKIVRKRKLKRFKKGSKQAKTYMRTLRAVKHKRLHKRKRTYRNGLYTRHKRKKYVFG